MVRFNRGERTASAMENQLTALERKIDDLLAIVDEHAHETTDAPTSDSKSVEHKPEK